LFWVSAIAPFMVVVIGGVFAFLVKGDEHDIPIVSAGSIFFLLFRLQKQYVFVPVPDHTMISFFAA
jgi:hypothetical protein